MFDLPAQLGLNVSCEEAQRELPHHRRDWPGIAAAARRFALSPPKTGASSSKLTISRAFLLPALRCATTLVSAAATSEICPAFVARSEPALHPLRLNGLKETNRSEAPVRRGQKNTAAERAGTVAEQEQHTPHPLPTSYRQAWGIAAPVEHGLDTIACAGHADNDVSRLRHLRNPRPWPSDRSAGSRYPTTAHALP